MDPLEKVMLDGPGDEKEQLQLVLLNNVDVFPWNHLDMVGISPIVASHKLNIIPTARPVR